ncbi:RimK-like protein [Mameliella alba]|uniref:RimK-like protein n=1 Tax=Mameliella alba TaxID=561184 RepID=UPI000EB5E64F|nr:RimK-like protein [Mameliella alba]
MTLREVFGKESPGHCVTIPSTYLRAKKTILKRAKIKKDSRLIRDVQVLILSSELDFSTDRICIRLRENGTQFLRLNRESLSDHALSLNPSGPVLTCSTEAGTWSVSNKLLSVWWRQGTFDRKFSEPQASLEDQISKTQWSAFMRSMMVFDKARWVNHPSQTYRAETKAVQLLEASRVGFEVPRTLMTNDRNAKVEQSIGSEIVLKSIDTLLLRQGDDQLFGYTQPVNWEEVSNDSLHIAPATVQHFISNKIDLRVTVVGDQLWCVGVFSSEGQISGDWRLTPKRQLKIQDFDLPVPVSQKCIKLTKALGLTFGAIDLAYSNGKYWFVEINPTGEWGWIDFDGRAISNSIADLLAGEC